MVIFTLILIVDPVNVRDPDPVADMALLIVIESEPEVCDPDIEFPPDRADELLVVMVTL